MGEQVLSLQDFGQGIAKILSCDGFDKDGLHTGRQGLGGVQFGGISRADDDGELWVDGFCRHGEFETAGRWHDMVREE